MVLPCGVVYVKVLWLQRSSPPLRPLQFTEAVKRRSWLPRAGTVTPEQLMFPREGAQRGQPFGEVVEDGSGLRFAGSASVKSRSSPGTRRCRRAARSTGRWSCSGAPSRGDGVPVLVAISCRLARSRRQGLRPSKATTTCSEDVGARLRIELGLVVAHPPQPSPGRHRSVGGVGPEPDLHRAIGGMVMLSMLTSRNPGRTCSWEGVGGVQAAPSG